MPTHHIYAAIDTSDTSDTDEELIKKFNNTYIRKNLNVTVLNSNQYPITDNIDNNNSNNVVGNSDDGKNAYHVVVLVKYNTDYKPKTEAATDVAGVAGVDGAAGADANMEIYYIVEKNKNENNSPVVDKTKTNIERYKSADNKNQITIPLTNIFEIVNATNVADATNVNTKDQLKAKIIANDAQIKNFVLYDIVIQNQDNSKNMTSTSDATKIVNMYKVLQYNSDTNNLILTIDNTDTKSKTNKINEYPKLNFNQHFKSNKNENLSKTGGGKSALQNEKSELAPMKLNKQKAGKNFSLKNHNH